MVKISVDLWSENDLKNKFDALSRKGDWDKECDKCKNPEFYISQIVLEKYM